MSIMVSEQTRDLLTAWLPMILQHKEEIIRRMEINLRGVDGDCEPFGRSEIAAEVLTNLLITQATRIAESGAAVDLITMTEEHRSAGIEGRHYSRFGDAIRPTFIDVLGIRVPQAVTSAWIDAFWAVIRAAQTHRTLVSV